MNLKFWGVRGSLPSPASTVNLESKIQAIVSAITPNDLKDEETRQAFILSLPSRLTSFVGGNTACVSIRISKTEMIILDAGSGLRELSQNISKEIKTFHIFLSHFHWDHIQGIPFFAQIYQNDCEIHFYSPVKNAEQTLSCQMSYPFFPVKFSDCASKISFHTLSVDKSFCVAGTYVRCHEITHPNKAYSYLLNLENGKKILYATDFEIGLKDFEETEENRAAFQDADIMIIDSQYTVQEFLEREHWGHPMFCYSIDFANHYRAKKVYLFHHDPAHDDKCLYDILEKARTYTKKILKSDMQIFLAKEGIIEKL